MSYSNENMTDLILEMEFNNNNVICDKINELNKDNSDWLSKYEDLSEGISLEKLRSLFENAPSDFTAGLICGITHRQLEKINDERKESYRMSIR